jgi:hypothetical protein
MSDFHSPAFWLAGRAIFKQNRGHALPDFDVSNPDAVLAAAAKEIAETLAAYLNADPHTRPGVALELQAMMAGGTAQRRGAARNPEWGEAVARIERGPAVAFMAQQAGLFVRDHWNEIQRLARTLAAEKRLPAHMATWLVGSKPKVLAA